jgi:hypothetical protein
MAGFRVVEFGAGQLLNRLQFHLPTITRSATLIGTLLAHKKRAA